MYRTFLLSAILYFCFQQAHAQTESPVYIKPHKIAVFAPLYLDSVFKNHNFRYENNFPRFVVPGLDFIQGARISLDSFPIENNAIETYFYDSKADSLSIPNLISTHALDDMEMIIGSVKDKEMIQLAGFAKSNDIPFISATFPNDGGITGNSNFFILNPTLKTHCEQIFHTLQTFDTCQILQIRKAGNMEDRIAGYFNSIKNAQNLNNELTIKTLMLDSNFNLIKTSLDSTKTNLIIGGSMDEKFVVKMVTQLNSYTSKYRIKLIGMPNWESFDYFGKSNTNNTIKLLFTSPYYNEKFDSCSNIILDAYNNIYKGKPTENAFKGFECMYVFSRLLNQYPGDFKNHINDTAFQLFTPFNFVPVRAKNETDPIDHFENKKLFMLSRKGGINSLGW